MQNSNSVYSKCLAIKLKKPFLLTLNIRRRNKKLDALCRFTNVYVYG